MQHLVFKQVVIALFSLIVFSIPLIHAQTVNGIPTCAKECALEFIGNSDCPLRNQTCVCNYLSFYNTCVEKECNGTDLASANEPPIPYYIPDATISIGITPGCSLSTPNFPRPTATATLPSTAEGDSPPSTAEAPTTTRSTAISPLMSEGEARTVTTTAYKNSSTELATLTSTESGARGQTNNTPRQSQTVETGSTGSTSRSGVSQATSTSGAEITKVVNLKIAVAGLLGFAVGVL